MTIKTSQNHLTFSEIESEFGKNPSRSLGDYRRSISKGGVNWPLDDGIPTSGTISFSDFLGKQHNIIIVLSGGGTSYRHRFENPKFTFAGKTGSSQIKRFTEAQREAEVKQESLPYKDRDHALFVAFAPYKDPQYAISVLVEHGGSGGKAAAPIAKKVIKKVLERHELRRSVNNQIGESV